MKNFFIGAFFLSLAGSIWGGMFIAVRLSVNVIPPIPLVWLRYATAILFLYLVVRLRHVSLYIAPKDRRLLLATAVIGPALSIVTQETGTMLTSAEIGSIITAATPAFMLIFGWQILKEQMTFKKMLSILLATIGAICIVFDPETMGEGSLLGGFFLIIAALTWALMSVLLKLLKNYSVIALSFHTIWIALLLLTPYGIYWSLTAADFAAMQQPTVWGSVLYLGIISTTCGFCAWNKGLTYMEASIAGLFMFWQPVVGTLLGWLLLGEPLTMNFLLGSILTAIGIVLAIGKHKSKQASVQASIENQIN